MSPLATANAIAPATGVPVTLECWPGTSFPVEGSNPTMLPSRITPPYQPVLSQPAPSAYTQLTPSLPPPGVASGQAARTSGVLGVSAWNVITRLSAIVEPAQLGSGTARSARNASSTIATDVIVLTSTV